MKIEIKPVEDIKKFHRFWSFRFSAIGTLIMGFLVAWPDTINTIWQSMPDEAKGIIPHNFVPLISLFIFALAAISRLIKQNVVNDKAAKENAS